MASHYLEHKNKKDAQATALQPCRDVWKRQFSPSSFPTKKRKKLLLRYSKNWLPPLALSSRPVASLTFHLEKKVLHCLSRSSVQIAGKLIRVGSVVIGGPRSRTDLPSGGISYNNRNPPAPPCLTQRVCAFVLFPHICIAASVYFPISPLFLKFCHTIYTTKIWCSWSVRNWELYKT